MDSNNTSLTKTVPKLQFFFQGLDFNGHYRTVHLLHSPWPTHTYPNFFPNHPHYHPKKTKYSTQPTQCPTMSIFQIYSSKGATNFQLILERIFRLLNFSIMLNIFKFQEYLSNFRKAISRNKEFMFWHLQNFINEKPCQSKTSDVFWMEHVF